MRNTAHSVPPEDIFAIPIGEKWIVFSPRNMTSGIVNRAAVEAVVACSTRDAVNIPETVSELWRKLSEAPATLSHPSLVFEKLVIIPTRSCNMRCVYCDFDASATHSSTLDPVLACRLIDHAVEQLSKKAPAILRIHFFGGEPLVARQCVETVVHYARMVCARMDVTPWFEITTNGLFDPTAVPFIGDYMDSAVISIDGDKLTHDFSRQRIDGTGTYSSIAANIRRLSKFPVELSLRTCISSRSVDAMTTITSHFCSEFEFDLLSFEMMTPNKSSLDSGLASPEPCRFAAGVLKAEPLAASYEVCIVQGPSELIGPRSTSCPVGSGTLMLTPEGMVTVCYLEVERWKKRGLDPVVGRVDTVSGTQIEQSKLEAIDSLLAFKPRCIKCFCRYTCAGGCHIDQTPPGCSLEYSDRCKATRIITAGRLLHNLEGTTAAESFAGQDSIMRAVAENLDDRLTAWPVIAKRGHQ